MHISSLPAGKTRLTVAAREVSFPVLYGHYLRKHSSRAGLRAMIRIKVGGTIAENFCKPV
ncbi:hypothetical protein [Celeribacter sp.]|uniref:hypothetical protein n=1 Tax=Celeribacter sp. TaxID=1890673 RepID=UPI003A8F11EF